MDRSPNFKIVVAYETFATAIQARELSERLAAELQLDNGMDCDFWKFELLADPQLGGQAAAEAAAASMVIISTRGSGELPAQVKTWIESWPPESREEMSALVGLVDASLEGVNDAPPVCDYLRRVAGERGMDFFCHAGDWWQFDLEPLTKHRPARIDFANPAQYLQRDHLGAGWGIND